MSPRKTILRELSRSAAGAGAFTRPASIRGFADHPDRYQKAVNELLQARLVEGRKDDDGHMTIAINEARRGEVERELRPIWARPALWAVVILITALGAGLAI
jgi:hypothetical protein